MLAISPMSKVTGVKLNALWFGKVNACFMESC